MAGDEQEIGVAIVDDDAWARERLSEWLRDQHDTRLVGAYESVDGFLTGGGIEADVVVLDVQLRHDPRVAENVGRISLSGPRVLLVSAFFDEESIRGALSAGASGFYPKSSNWNSLIAAIRDVYLGRFVISQQAAMAILNDHRSGAPSFTQTETLFLSLYASGLSLEATAVRMGVKYETAKGYAKAVREKYRAAGRDVDTPVNLYKAAVADGVLTRQPIV